jgi:hemerythrin-like domain-containing protein
MALAHNVIIRGLNSMYLQAPHIPSSDQIAIRDFLIYAQCWCESMEHHHHSEEEIFFPYIEQLTGIPGIMEQNKEQHRQFTPGFERFHEYARTCTPKDFNGDEFRLLIEGFAEPLHRHLQDEIATLRALDKYDSEQVRQAYKRLEKELMNTDNVRLSNILHEHIITDLAFSIVSLRSCSVEAIGDSRAWDDTISPPSRSLYLTSFTIYSCGNIVEPGDIIHAPHGANGENWHIQVQEKVPIELPDTSRSLR